MLPPIVERQIRFAEAVAAGLRLAGSNCPKGLESLRTRLIQGAQTIDALIDLVKTANFTAQLNHDTILEMRRNELHDHQISDLGEPDGHGDSPALVSTVVAEDLRPSPPTHYGEHHQI